MCGHVVDCRHCAAKESKLKHLERSFEQHKEAMSQQVVCAPQPLTVRRLNLCHVCTHMSPAPQQFSTSAVVRKNESVAGVFSLAPQANGMGESTDAATALSSLRAALKAATPLLTPSAMETLKESFQHKIRPQMRSLSKDATTSQPQRVADADAEAALSEKKDTSTEEEKVISTEEEKFTFTEGKKFTCTEEEKVISTEEKKVNSTEDAASGKHPDPVAAAREACKTGSPAFQVTFWGTICVPSVARKLVSDSLILT